MKLSQIDQKELFSLTPDEKWQLLCEDMQDKGESAPVALLLGSAPQHAIHRATAAAALYRAGRVAHIVPSGGVAWEHEGKTLTEAELMAQILMENGVPKEAIIMENEARTTKENMIYGTLQINRALSFDKMRRVIIVTSIEHMKRSMGLAKCYLPRHAELFAYPAVPYEGVTEWLKNAENVSRLDHELKMIKKLITCGEMADIELTAAHAALC